MPKSWLLLIIIALITIGFYTGFEVYNSITGSTREFQKTVVPIQVDLGVDVLNHIQSTGQTLYYKGEGEAELTQLINNKTGTNIETQDGEQIQEQEL